MGSPFLTRLGFSDTSFLLNLTNLSVKNSRGPTQQTTSINILLYKKKGSHHDPESYRPINLTSGVFKIMDKINKSQVKDYLPSDNLLHDNQSGFIKLRSYATCHFDFLNAFNSPCDNEKSAFVVYLDMMKVFDSVPHTNLISKILSFGLTDPLHAWLSLC